MNRSFSPIALFIAFFLILGTGCRYKTGNGNIVSKEVSVGSFDRVEVAGAINVHVTQGPQAPVRIEGDENLLRYISIEEHGGELEVKTRGGYNLRPTQKMKVFVSSPNYKKLRVSGACDIIGETSVKSGEKLEMEVSGAGNIKMDVDAPQVETRISGAGKIALTGKTRDFEMALSGAGKAVCYDLLAENVQVKISGAGSAEVYASVKLDAQVSGAGNVRYKGDAKQLQQQISGAGSVKKAD
jgi:hypothetical protein